MSLRSPSSLPAHQHRNRGRACLGRFHRRVSVVRPLRPKSWPSSRSDPEMKRTHLALLPGESLRRHKAPGTPPPTGSASSSVGCATACWYSPGEAFRRRVCGTAATSPLNACPVDKEPARGRALAWPEARVRKRHARLSSSRPPRRRPIRQQRQTKAHPAPRHRAPPDPKRRAITGPSCDAANPSPHPDRRTPARCSPAVRAVLHPIPPCTPAVPAGRPRPDTETRRCATCAPVESQSARRSAPGMPVPFFQQ